MNGSPTSFVLSKDIERYLAILSKVYAKEDQREKLEIIVNAHARIQEEWTYDNWNGGTYGHALYLSLPEHLFLAAVGRKQELQNQIQNDLNRVHNVQNEHIAAVFIEMDLAGGEDWRSESGVFHKVRRFIPPATGSRIWGDSGYRVFLSHKADVKVESAELKARLKVFGITSFVAHEDILPTKEWQDEIENALYTMDAFVALMTETFHESDWTDQEVGFALGRSVPIIAVRLGRDPYGFIGKFQALSCDWNAAAKEIAGLLITHPSMLNSFIAAVRNCPSYDNGNSLAEILPRIDRLSDVQVEQLVEAFNTNDQVQGSYGFNGTGPWSYGDGLAAHLSRLTGRKYKLSSSGTLITLP